MIEIAPYDPAWPALFAAEAARIRESFGLQAMRIEHVGSTAVPGLAAKPVIDIQVSVESLASRELFEELLKQLGYTHFALGAFDLVYQVQDQMAFGVQWREELLCHLQVELAESDQVSAAFGAIEGGAPNDLDTSLVKLQIVVRA